MLKYIKSDDLKLQDHFKLSDSETGATTGGFRKGKRK